MNVLDGLQVLVTRPRAQAQTWARQLQAEGAHATVLPVMEIEALDSPAERQTIKDKILALADYHKAIFVSQNAVAEAARWIDEYWPQAPLAIDYFAVGAATATALRERGISASAPTTAMNSEALLSLPALRAVDGEKVLIFRGRGGRPLLAEQLRQRGARVEFCELYRRRLPAGAASRLQQWWRRIHNPANANSRYVIAVHSGESLGNLNHLIQQGEPSSVQPGQVSVGASFKRIPLLVPSERVAERARELGYEQLLVAANATDAAMTKALVDWFKP